MQCAYMTKQMSKNTDKYMWIIKNSVLRFIDG